MMRTALIALALVGSSIPLVSCATGGGVEATTLKGFALAQVTFHALQQSAIAAVESGVIKGTTKATVIQLVDRGQALETAASNAATAGDVTTLRASEQQLSTVITQLAPLVPPKGQ